MNLLLLTDFSLTSHNAGKYAIQLLNNTVTTIFILHVDTISLRGDECTYIEDSKRHSQEKLNDLVQEFQRNTKNDNITFTTLYSSSSFIDSIRNTVFDRNIDMIIMGVNGDTLPKTGMMGSHTYEVFKKIKCPILAVPEYVSFKSWDSIVFPIDYAAVLHQELFNVFDKLKEIKISELKIIEINKSTNSKNPNLQIGELLEEKLVPKNIHYHKLKEEEELELFSSTIAYLNFDLVILLAKNINICEKLKKLDSKNLEGMPIKFPLLILH